MLNNNYRDISWTSIWTYRWNCTPTPYETSALSVVDERTCHKLSLLVIY